MHSSIILEKIYVGLYMVFRLGYLKLLPKLHWAGTLWCFQNFQIVISQNLLNRVKMDRFWFNIDQIYGKYVTNIFLIQGRIYDEGRAGIMNPEAGHFRSILTSMMHFPGKWPVQRHVSSWRQGMYSPPSRCATGSRVTRQWPFLMRFEEIWNM